MAPPIYVKGGQWTNVEDQILRAAVSKYGLTQWARVASLLPKKTAKQAKARWNEYLNPTIKRNEWSLEEDEKLLSLAKLLPNQWRSIAPIMGRTPTQCVERYQRLLDKAMGAADESDEEAAEFKLSGPGIETLPALGNAYESMPSRPDMEDMDEDEQEMLSEAKARLANTLGKKAKRKERERMLQENRRITLLEKRRDLKAAGVRVSLESKNKKRRKEFDYNADIPHERAPPPGLYDTSEEDARNERECLAFQEQVKHRGIQPDEKEKSKKKPDDSEKKASKRQRQELSDAAKLFSDVADQELKRRKLDLPPAEIDQQRAEELESSHKSITAKGALRSGPGDDDGHRQSLLDATFIKKFQKFLRSMFSKIPPPTNTANYPLPDLSKSIEALADVHVDEEIEDRGSTKEILPVEHKSSVTLQGLQVLHPDRLNYSCVAGQTLLQKAIASEFQKLVKYDYKQHVDLTYSAEPVEALDAASVAKVQDEIAKELRSRKARKVPPSRYTLPKSALVVEDVMQALHDLNESSNRLDQQLNKKAAAYEQAVNEKYGVISDLAHQYQDAAINEALLSKVAELEAQAIEKRSASLHSFVEKVDAAESACRLN